MAVNDPRFTPPIQPQIDVERWGRILPRNIDAVVEQTIREDLIAWIRDNPKTFAPANPHYVKTHRNAPGTVRQWFRQMRAADFARDRTFATGGPRAFEEGAFWWTPTELRPWTLFDTQQVVERETAAHYLRPDLTTIYFVQDGRVVGRVENVAIERSVYPRFRSTVQSSSRGITLEDLQRFVDDDYARFMGRALDQESPLR
jgi:hypothetical protein